MDKLQKWTGKWEEGKFSVQTGKSGLSEEGTQMGISYLENTTLFACKTQLTVTSVMDSNEYIFVMSGNGYCIHANPYCQKSGRGDCPPPPEIF